MNAFVVTQLAAKISENVEKNIYQNLEYSKDFDIYFLQHVFDGINFPSEEMKREVIEKFNRTNKFNAVIRGFKPIQNTDPLICILN